MNQFHDHLSQNLTWYRRWHEKPHHSVVHYALLFGVFMLLGVSFFGTAKAAGTTYYVDASITDTNVGSATPDCTNYNPNTFTCSGGTASAYKTIADINAKTFVAGDQILFRAGATFTGTIIPKASGTSTNRITYGSFGSGAKPIITGLTTVSGWTSLGGNKWESTNSVTTLGTVNLILINGFNTAYGRTPNTGYWTAASATATSITDGTRLNASTTNWTGANVAIRTAAWHLDRTTVTSASGSTINFSQPDYKPEAQNGYFLQNHTSTLDLQNEWAFTPAEKKVVIYSTTAPVNVKVPTIEYGANLNGKNYITFDGLNFQGFNTHGVYVNGSTGITVQNADFSFIADSGVYTYTNTGDSLMVSNSTFNEINSGGVITRGSPYTTVQNSTFNKIGNLEGMAGGPQSGGDVNYTAVQVSNYSKVLYNTITNVGYVGIRFNGPGVLVQGNYVDRTTYIKDDGGGIYTFPNEGDYDEPVEYLGSDRRTVRDNIVLNAIGAPWGKKPSPNGLLGKSEGMCIYNDGTSSYTDYINNTMAYCRWGYFSNGGKYNTISGNTIYMVPNAVYGNSTGDIYGITQTDYKGETWTTLEGNNYTNNTIVLGATNAGLGCGVANYALEVLNRGNTLPSDWTASNNIYANPLDQTNPLIYSEVGVSGGPCSTLAQWKTGTGKDTGTTGSPITVSSASSIKFEYATSSPKVLDLSAGYVDMKGVVQACSRTIPAYSSVILLKKPNTTCTGGAPDPTPPTVSITSPTAGMTIQGIYPITATATDNIAVAQVDFYKGTSLIGSDNQAPYSISWDTAGNTGLIGLSAKATDTSGNVGTSATVNVTVGTGPSNALPSANAGADKTVTLPTNSVTLSGSGTDTDGSIASYLWTKISGSGNLPSPANTAATTVTGLTQGTSTFRLMVTDNLGATGTDDVNVVVNSGADTTAPTFTYPFQTFNAGIQYILIYAEDEAGGSGIDKVEFYIDGVLKGTDTSRNPPYGFEFDSTAVANGTHTVYAIACDIAGNCRTSTTASFTIDNPDITPPTTVAITVPSAGATLSNTATITATATDNIGIDHVDFYHGSTVIGGDTAAPFSIQWDTTNVTNNTYALTARAYDAAGNTKTSSAVSVSVANIVIPPPDTTAPTVSITAPASGTTVSGNVTLAATASDTESGITTVAFYHGGTTWIEADTTGTPGYAVTWDTTTVPNGTYSITARAADGAPTSNIGISSPITLIVNNDIIAPTVTLAAPATAGQNIAGTFTLKATATDDVSMAPPGKVEFYRGTTLIGSTQVPGTDSNFELQWNTMNVANGTYSITAKAYDKAGNSATTTARNVVVNNIVPACYINSFTATPNIITSGNSSTLSWTTTDCQNVVLGSSGITVGTGVYGLNGSVSTGPLTATRLYGMSASPSTSASCSASGGRFSATTSTCTKNTSVVVNNVIGNAGPDQTITLPTNTVTLRGSGTPAVGSTITKYKWTKSSGSGTITNSTSATTTVTGLTKGTSVFKVQVTDNLNRSTTDTVSIVVNPAPVSTATFTGLRANETSGTTTVLVDVASTNTITKVEFFINGVLIGSDTTYNPFSATWNTTLHLNGIYKLTAKATDKLGGVTTSAPVDVIVAN